MIEDLRAIGDGDRRAGSSLRLGEITEVRLAKPVSHVKVRLDEGVVTDWLPYMTWAAGALRVWSPPTVGEACSVISPSGEPHLGVAAPGLFTTAIPSPSDSPDQTVLMWEDGAYLLYRFAGEGAGKMVISAPCGLMVAGDLAVTGDVVAIGGPSLRQHIHCGVLPGGSCTLPPSGMGSVACGMEIPEP